MLDGLDDIDWASLGTAYEDGGAGLPGAIRNLASEAPADWVAAVDFLYGHLCHQQSTVYEATAVAIPFLQELLRSPDVKCRGRILELLGDMARANSYLAVHGDMSVYDDERDQPEFREQLARELQWVRATRAAVWRGVDTYVELLAHDARTLRIGVPYSLALLARHAADDIPFDVAARNPFARMSQGMHARLEWEREPLVRASLVHGLAAFADRDPENARTLRHRLADEAFPVRLAAALCLVEIDPATVPPEAVAILEEALTELDRADAAFVADTPGIEAAHHPLNKAYEAAGAPLTETAGEFDDIGADEDFAFPWRDGHTRFDVIEAVVRLPAEPNLARMLPRLIDQVRAANEHTARSVVAPILAYVFRGRSLSGDDGPDDLGDFERSVLEAAFDNPLLWVTMTYTASAFDSVGLDDDRDRWRQLLRRVGEDPSSAAAERLLELVVRRDRNVSVADDEPLTNEHRRSVQRIVIRKLATDAVMPLLADYPMLRRLDLCGSPITASGVRALPVFPVLEELHLTGAELDVAAVERIATMTTLRDLNLGGTNLDDHLLPHLLPLQELTQLGLFGVPITDAAVDTLVRFDKLTRLVVGKTGLTEDGRARLQAAFPEMRGLDRP